MRILHISEISGSVEELYYLIRYDIEISLCMDGSSKEISAKTSPGVSDKSMIQKLFIT